MNERIKQLMIRAIGGVPCYDASVGLSLNQEEAEKFAELLVKEFAQLVEDNIDPQNAWITPGSVRQHFGVEE